MPGVDKAGLRVDVGGPAGGPAADERSVWNESDFPPEVITVNTDPNDPDSDLPDEQLTAAAQAKRTAERFRKETDLAVQASQSSISEDRRSAEQRIADEREWEAQQHEHHPHMDHGPEGEDGEAGEEGEEGERGRISDPEGNLEVP